MEQKNFGVQLVAAGGLGLYLARDTTREVGQWTVIRKQLQSDSSWFEFGRMSGLTAGEVRQHLDRLFQLPQWQPAVVALETSAAAWDRYSRALQRLA